MWIPKIAPLFDAGQGDLIEYEGRYWMPVEVTVPGEGFFNAWRIEEREWRQANARDTLSVSRDPETAKRLRNR
jgi:hypothetical protein